MKALGALRMTTGEQIWKVYIGQALEPEEINVFLVEKLCINSPKYILQKRDGICTYRPNIDNLIGEERIHIKNK